MGTHEAAGCSLSQWRGNEKMTEGGETTKVE